MASITLRSVKGSPLTNNEIDANFTNINNEVATKLTATSYTAADVLSKLLTVDTDAAGINASTLLGRASDTANTANTVVLRDASGNFSAGTITATLTGNVTGNVTGTVTNGVVTTGSYSNPTWITALAGSKVTSIPNSSLTNSSITINGSAISLGGSINSLAASNTWTGQQTFIDNQFRIIDDSDNTKVLSFQVSNIATGTTRTLTAPNETGTIATQAWTTSNHLPLTGGTLTGRLTLVSTTPTNASHATTKSYVDSLAYVITSGAGDNVGYTGGFNDASNYLDVFPPSGKTMSNIVAFIPSIRMIHFSGDVNGDDSMRCVYAYQSDRIRVWTQNTEMRAVAAVNWLAVWR